MKSTEPPQILPVENDLTPAEANRAAARTLILLAEDDPTNQHVTKSILEKFGYLVEIVNNGREALNLLEKNDYALILMDCMMPVLDGYETTKIIRNKASAVRNHAIPIIALTANAFTEARGQCLAAGMDDYLSKPIKITNFIELLKKWLPDDSAADKGVTSPIAEGEPCSETVDNFNKVNLMGRIMGNVQLSHDMASLFIDNGPQYVEAIRSALAAQDSVILQRSAHKLKGAAETMSLPRLSETALQIERAAHTGDLEQAELIYPELVRRFTQAAEVLRENLLLRG